MLLLFLILGSNHFHHITHHHIASFNHNLAFIINHITSYQVDVIQPMALVVVFLEILLRYCPETNNG